LAYEPRKVLVTIKTGIQGGFTANFGSWRSIGREPNDKIGDVNGDGVVDFDLGAPIR